jgi:hypothetical protein
MRVETTTRTLYKFHELTEEAKAKAIEQWREDIYDMPFFWTDEALEAIKKGLDAFQCDLRDYSINWESPSQSDFTIRYPENAEELTGNRLRTWLINNADSGTLTEPKHYGKYISGEKGQRGRYQRYSRILKNDSYLPFTGVCYDESFLDPVRKFIKCPDNSSLSDIMEAACYAVNKDIESEIEYQNTDAAIIETLEANDYEFTEKGKLA